MVSEACCNRDQTQAVFPDPVIPAIMEVKGCWKRNRWHFCENIGTVKGFNVGVISKAGWNCFKWGETSITLFRHHVPLHTIHSTKGFFADRTKPTHGNSLRAECRLKNRWNVEHLYRFSGHKILLFSSSTTITTIFPLFSLHHHHHRHHISIVFPPHPPPPYFYCFLSFAHSFHFFLHDIL